MKILGWDVVNFNNNDYDIILDVKLKENIDDPSIVFSYENGKYIGYTILAGGFDIDFELSKDDERKALKWLEENYNTIVNEYLIK